MVCDGREHMSGCSVAQAACMFVGRGEKVLGGNSGVSGADSRHVDAAAYCCPRPLLGGALLLYFPLQFLNAVGADC
jgi:hypothetical protein